MHLRSNILVLLLTGCGDSLISGENLESLLGVMPLPAEPAWEVRWYAGPDTELHLGCALLSAELTEDDVYWESLYALPPDVASPPVWVTSEEENYRYAIAMLTLVDAERYLGIEEPGESADSLEFGLGVWGGVDDRALLFAEGDLDAMAEDALLLPDLLEVAKEEPIWLGMLPELASVKEDLAGALYPLPDEEEEDLYDTGLSITQAEYLSEAAHEVLSGEILGDELAVECDE